MCQQQMKMQPTNGAVKLPIPGITLIIIIIIGFYLIPNWNGK